MVKELDSALSSPSSPLNLNDFNVGNVSHFYVHTLSKYTFARSLTFDVLIIIRTSYVHYEINSILIYTIHLLSAGLSERWLVHTHKHTHRNNKGKKRRVSERARRKQTNGVSEARQGKSKALYFLC